MKGFFDFKNIRGDLLGGLTAGIVALPLGLAFGVSSGMGATAGLLGAIFVGFFAALFGGTPTQISGPTAPMTAVSMGIIAGIVSVNGGDLEKSLAAILFVFLLAGLFQIGLGLLGLGKYIKYIPYPVVSGFMTAIGVIILITQIAPVIGYVTAEDDKYVAQFKSQAEENILAKILHEESQEGILVLESFEETMTRSHEITEERIMAEARSIASTNSSGVVGSVRSLPRMFQHINYTELALALFTILIIYGFKKITLKVPSTLVALFVVSGAAVAMDLSYRPIQEIVSTLPVPHFEIFTGLNWSQISPYIFTALALAFLGAIDSLLTSVVADNMTKTQHKPNQELVGQGIGNSIAAVFGAIPGAGATIRTLVNINSGGKTKISGMVAALLLLTIMLFLGPIASKIPAAVLAGILVTVGIGVMDYKGLRAIRRAPISDVLVMLIVLVLAVSIDLVMAVGFGMVMSSLIFMKKMGDINKMNTSLSSLKAKRLWVDDEGPDGFGDNVYIKQLNGPLFFGFTDQFREISSKVPSTATHVIIRMDKVPYMDQSGLYAFEDAVLNLKKNNVEVCLVGPKNQPLGLLKGINLIPGLVDEEMIFDNFGDCMTYLTSTSRETEEKEKKKPKGSYGQL